MLALLGACLLGTFSARAERRCTAAPDLPAGGLTTLDYPAPSPLPANERRVLAGPGFGLLTNAGALAELGCAPAGVARPGLLAAVLEAQAMLGVDPELTLLLSLSPLSCSSLYYLPLSNDVEGIGYAHTSGAERFDLTPEQRLEGIAFLNDWPYWREHPGELESAFAHELGHRWGARVQAHIPGQPPEALLGRDREHWSYFFDSAGSPLEGNVWRESSDGFVSDSPRYPSRFSSLDLYLMGVAPASEVEPLRLLIEPQTTGSDCLGQRQNAGSPPQTCGPAALQARALDLTLADIIAEEGPRRPEAAAAPRSVQLLTLVLEHGGAPLGSEDCAELARTLEQRIAGFALASSGRLLLENALGQGLDCAALTRASASDDRAVSETASSTDASHRSTSPGCTFCAGSERGSGGPASGLLALLVGATFRKLAACRTRRRPRSSER